MTTMDDDGFGDAEQATAEGRPKVPEIVARIGPPPRGAFTRPAPRRSYLVEQVIRSTDEDGRTTYTDTRGVIGRGQLHILAGEGGAGKGRWLLTIAAALAASDSPKLPDPAALADLTAHPGGMDNVCGLRVNGIPEDEKVLVLLGEDDATDIHQRFEGVAEALGWQKNAAREDRLVDRFRWGSAHGLTFYIVETARSLISGEIGAKASGDFEALREWLRDNGPWAFIALDPMARFAGVDENDNPLQHKVYTFVESLTMVNDKHPDHDAPAVVVVDHTAKPQKGNENEAPSQHWIRGASAKVNAARVAMIMVPGAGDFAWVDCEGRTADEEGFDGSETANVGVGDVVWHVVKNNGQQKAKPVALSFTKHGGLYVEAPADAKARRKRQFYAAQKRRDTQKTKGEADKPKKPASRKAGPTPPTPSADDLEDYA